jgi:glutamate-1-semialdehyde 2,1-aminomutase
MAYGPLLLGHAPPILKSAIIEQLQKGTTYGTPHQLEVEYAKKLIECVPCADGVLVCNSGTEATMQGIRIMRAYTGKDKIAKFEGAYHGWHDYASWSVYMDPEKIGPVEQPNAYPESAGIPSNVKDNVLVLPFHDRAFDLIEEHAAELAGVMIEPVFGNWMVPTGAEYLKKLREVTQRLGIPLMFDEVITGFRMALGGGQEYYEVLPDLATYGKIVGGGLPVGAVGCTNEMLTAVTAEVSISVSGTFSGNPTTLAAGNAMLGYLMENQQVYDEMAAKGDRLRDGFNDWSRAKGYPATMTGLGSMFQLHMKEPPITKIRDLLGQHQDALNDLQYYLRLNGIFIPWCHLAFFSTAHTDEDIEQILEAHKISVEATLSAHGIK